jgi:TPR repeat protein
MVGAIYWNGDGVAKDQAAAAHWFEIADLAGETRAAKMLGDEAFGRLVKAAEPADKDAILEVAIGWYEKAVEVEPMPEAKAQAQQSLAMLSEWKQKQSAR